MIILVCDKAQCHSCSNCLHNHADEESCAIHQDMEPCDDWTEKAEGQQYGHEEATA